MSDDLSKKLSTYLSKVGRKGGRAGGPARAAKLSANRRVEIARNAAAKRWTPVCPACGGPLCPHDVCVNNWCEHDHHCTECANREWAEIEAKDNARYYEGWGEVFNDDDEAPVVLDPPVLTDHEKRERR